MLQREKQINSIFDLNENLLRLKARIQNPEAAAEVRGNSKEIIESRSSFNLAEYEEYLRDNPSLSYLHLVTNSEDEE